MNMGGAASSAVAAGAMVGAVALAGSAPATPATPATLASHVKEYSLTPRSTMSLTPNTSNEELRIAAGKSLLILACVKLNLQ